MCFTSAPAIQKPQAMPTQRDANIAGVQKRQAAAGNGSAADTIATSPLGDPAPAPTFKSKLGA